MTNALTFTTGRGDDGAVVLTATGEIDMSNAAAFATALTTADAEAGGNPFVLDLTRVEYLDSAGLAVLFPHAGHLRLLATPLLAPLLAIVGLEDISTIRDS